jgi:hypothetical protein
MTKRLAIDPNNPPANLIVTDGTISWATVGGYVLDAERRFAEVCKIRHKRNPEHYARPMCIVRLKAYRT